MKIKIIKEHDLPNLKIEESLKRWTLNFTDIINNNNKCYNLEILKTNKGWFLHSQYGRVGGTLAKEFRECNEQNHAETEAEKIIKSKIKKGYVEVKLLKADLGSDVGKAKIEKDKISIDSLEKVGIKLVEDVATQSKLHSEVQNLVKTWFGITSDFVEVNLDTKKSPLGQLSLDQVNKGKDILEHCRKLLQEKKTRYPRT